MKMDFFRRIKRKIRSEKRRAYFKLWKRFSHDTFYTHPKLMTPLWYASNCGKLPNIKNPTNFNEQLMSINLSAYVDNRQKKLRIICADKYAVRKYIKDHGYEHILNKCYGVYDSFDDIDFDKLPSKFVLKVTNGSGQNYICHDKSRINKESLRYQFEKWITDNKKFGLTTGEWHYSMIKPRIIAEELLEIPQDFVSLTDYKFHCINGKLYGILVCYDRDKEHRSLNMDHYNLNWKREDVIKEIYHLNQREIECPSCFEKMKNIAEKLSSDFEYVRIDFYEINGKLYFGEMTFTPAGNYMSYYTDNELLNMLNFYRKTKQKNT